MPASDSKNELIPLNQFWSPRHWPTWLAIASMRLAAKLPFHWQINLGRSVGWLFYHLAWSRRHVCDVNLRLCFPELNDRERRELVRKTFISSGIGVLEIAIAWCGKKERYSDKVEIHGEEHLEQALREERGVLLLGAHLTCFEISGFLCNHIADLNVTYRANDKNPLFDAFMYNGRRRLYRGVYERKDIRGAMRCLKQNRVLWYAPDQDYGAQHSVFAPFFGVPAATITAGSRFANFNKSPVIFFSYYRKPDNSGYDLIFSPPLEGYPSGDEEEDARITNSLVEDAIRKHPDQYLWLHKRFKSPPPGSNRNPYKR